MMNSTFAVSLISGGLLVCLSSSAAAQGDLTAKWIWRKQDSYTLYNDTIVARKLVQLPAAASAQMIITADTRYRLFINGTWVNDGPCRSWPDHYQYDVIDVTPYLKAGDNEIRVIAKYFGTGTFHQIPQEAGLLAQLDVKTADGKTVRLASDETWEVAPVEAWIQNTVKRCIQMGPFEIYDARLETDGGFAPAAVRYDANAGPWKNLMPRDTALLTRTPFALRAFRDANTVNKEWRCYAFPTARLLYPGLIEANGKVSMGSAQATIVDVPSDTTLHIDAPGNTVTVNGDRGKDGAFALHAGENFLLMTVTSYFGHWQKETELRFRETSGYTLRNPLDKQTENPWCWTPIADAKYVNSDYEYALLSNDERKAVEAKIEGALDKTIAEAVSAESFRATFGDQIATLSSKTDLMQDIDYQFSERQVVAAAKDLVKEPDALLSDDARATVVHPSPQGDIELVYDLGEQNVGYYTFEVEAEAGLAIDVAAVEYIAPDGRVQHTGEYRNSMRYICKEGKNTFTSLDRRSGRFIFITLRNQTKPASIRYFGLIESTYPINPIGSFACSEQDLDRIWEISARTLKLCMEDTFTDCPLYEQTHWVGDARNEALLALNTFGATDITKRCLRLTGESVGKYPFALCQTPSTWEILIPSFSCLWGISVWEYYEYSGDEAFVRAMWPVIIQNMKGLEPFADERGLFSGPFWNFFDWSGIDDSHETVLHNNLLLVGALDAALKCAEVVNDPEPVAWLRERREKIATAVNTLWDDARGAYPDSVHGDGTISPKSCVHTSMLAYLYDVVNDHNRDAVVRNLVSPPEGMTLAGSPFASMFLFAALEKAGRQDLIVDSIRENYGPMLAAGATTVWESFPTGTTGSGGFPTRSHCHAWSSAPVYFLNRVVLGIVPQGIGGKTIVISPRPSGLSWAKGGTATINGPVSVSWTLKDGKMDITATAAKETELRFEHNDALKDVKVTFNGAPVS
ncbi:MAG: family 78 glycoside hydrolase catalytic domain [Candidatus Hydrogenedentes bacterium]|nr:family 78 glycoside hydrolase catalytic domain [Candidatus Hydrogenedentota bacterium]